MSIPGGSARNGGRVWSQWVAALTLHLLAVLDGLVGGWTSPFLAKLTTGRESLTITNDEASWIATLYVSSQSLGSIMATLIVRKFGAKKAALFAGVPHALGWLCFLIQESVISIYVARILGGSGLGMYMTTFPLYIGEIGDPKIRGALIATVAQGTGIGYLIGNSLGAYMSMKSFAVIGLSMSAIFLLAFHLIPDSSYYLVRKNRIEEAERSLKWYSRQADVKAELDALIAYVGEPKMVSVKEAVGELLTPLNRRLLAMILSIHVFMHISGVFVITSYLEILLRSLKINVMAPKIVVICVGIVAIVGGLVTTYTNDRCGRRVMLATSAAGVAVTFFLISVKFLLVRYGYSLISIQWIIIAEFVGYIFFLNIGLANVPCCLVSEIFPTEFKEIGTCVTNVVSSLAAFVGGKGYQFIIDVTSEEFLFFVYGVILIFLVGFTIVVVPETKNKSLHEIQNMFRRRKDRTIDLGRGSRSLGTSFGNVRAAEE